MEPEEEVTMDESVLSEEELEPFDWEDLLYESWLERASAKEEKKAR
jgi:hypothetical protein